MSKNLFDTCVFWSCVTRCGCRTTSSTLFTVSRKFAKIVATQGALAVSLTTAENRPSATVLTGGKLTAGVANTDCHIFPEIYIDHGDIGGNLPPVSTGCGYLRVFLGKFEKALI
jgi:hypothetical protein